jgi:hypothetical protein
VNSVSVQLVTHEFPFLWEEIHIPIPHRTDRARAEHILLDAAMEATRDVCDAAHRAMRVFHEKYGGVLEQPEPRVY